MAWLLAAMRSSLLRNQGILVVLVAVLHSLVYMVIIPPWQQPDEHAHFGHVLAMHDLNRQVSRADQASTASQILLDQSLRRFNHWWDTGQSTPPLKRIGDAEWVSEPELFYDALHQPPLYYMLCVGLYRLSLQAGWSLEAGLYLLRLFGVILSGAVVACIYLAMQEWLPGRPRMAMFAGLMVACLPMRAAIAASVNNDNLANLGAAVFGLGLVRLFRRGWHLPSLLLLLTGLILAIVTKRTTLSLLGVVVLALPLLFWLQHIRWAAGAAALLGWGVPVAGLTLASRYPEQANTFLITHLPQLAQYLLNENEALLLTLFRGGYITGPVVWNMLTNQTGLQFTYTTFWGGFGWTNVWLPGLLYQILGVGCGLLLVGISLLLLYGRWLASWQRSTLAVLFGWCLIHSFWTYIRAYPTATDILIAIPGRYLFPLLLPMAILSAAGLYTLWTLLRLPRWFFTLGLLLLGIFDLVCLALVLLYFSLR